MKVLLLLLLSIPCALSAQVKIFGKHPKVSTTPEMETIAADLPWNAFITKGTDSSNKKSDHFKSNAFDVRIVGSKGLFRIKNGRLTPKPALRKLNRAARSGEFDKWKEKYGIKVILLEIPTKDLKYGKYIIKPYTIKKDLKHFLDKSLHKYIKSHAPASGIHWHFARWNEFEKKEVIIHEQGKIEVKKDEITDVAPDKPSLIVDRTHSTPKDDPNFVDDPFDNFDKPKKKESPKPKVSLTPSIASTPLPRKDTTYTETIVSSDSTKYVATISVDWSTENFMAPKPKPKPSSKIEYASLWNICLKYVRDREIAKLGREMTKQENDKLSKTWVKIATAANDKRVERHRVLAIATAIFCSENAHDMDELRHHITTVKFSGTEELIRKSVDFKPDFIVGLFNGQVATDKVIKRTMANATYTTSR